MCASCCVLAVGWRVGWCDLIATPGVCQAGSERPHEQKLLSRVFSQRMLLALSHRVRRFSVAYVPLGGGCVCPRRGARRLTVAACVRRRATSACSASPAPTSTESFQTKIDDSVASEHVEEPPYYDKTDEQRAFIAEAVCAGGGALHSPHRAMGPAWLPVLPPRLSVAVDCRRRSRVCGTRASPVLPRVLIASYSCRRSLIPVSDLCAFVASGWLQMSASFMFEGLQSDDVATVVNAMHSEAVPAGSYVLRQGDQGEKFYVVATGMLAVIVNGHNTSQLLAGSHFGELALMFNTPR